MSFTRHSIFTKVGSREDLQMQDIPPNAKYDWFDNDTFEDWFIKVFLPVAKTKEITALISINLSSHFWMSCGYAESTMSSSFVCHPTQTKKTQPFDVAFFRPLKIKWHKILNDQKTKHTKESSLPKTAFPRLLKELTNELTSISSNIDEVLLINPSVNVFVFGDFNVHHKDWLT